MKKITAFLLFTFYFVLCTGGFETRPYLAFASQNPLVVPDGTGAQVRAGFNNALDTLNTVNSGPSAPATTEAYMLWADTTNNLLKQMNSTNTTWIVLGTLGASNLGRTGHLPWDHLPILAGRQDLANAARRPILSRGRGPQQHRVRLGHFLHSRDFRQ